MHCPHCGSYDPFYFFTIDKQKSKLSLSYGAIIVIAIILQLVFAFLGFKEGIFNWGYVQIISFIIVLVIIESILSAIRKSKIKGYQQEMTEVFKQVDDEKAIDRWANKLINIIDF